MRSILLIGVGRLGKNIVTNLSALQHEIMAVDISEERVEEVLPYVTGAQIGDGTSTSFLKSLGVGNYDVCIVAMGSDFRSSLETAYLLKELGAKKVVSRATEDVQEKFLLNNGADAVLYPEKEVAEWVSVKYTFDNVKDYMRLDETMSLFEISMPKGRHGSEAEKTDLAEKFDIHIIGIRKKGAEKWILRPDTLPEEGDLALIAGTIKNVQKYLRT